MLKVNITKLSLNKPKIELSESGPTIGSMIRWERKKRNYTLSEGALGICSISYLSKVENDLIEPSEEILSNLFDRFDLHEHVEYQYEKYEQIYLDIIDCIFNTKDINDYYYKALIAQKDYKSKLVIFAFYIYNNRLEKAKKIYPELEEEISKFNLLELNLFYYLTAKLLTHFGNYYQAMLVVKNCHILEKDSQLSILVDFDKVSLKLKLGRFFQVFPIIEKLEKRLLVQEHFTLYKQLQYLKLSNILYNYDYNLMAKNIDKLKSYSKLEKQYLLLKLAVFNDSDKYNYRGLESPFVSPEWYILSLIHYDQRNDFKTIESFITKRTQFGNHPLITQVEFFLKQKYTIDQESFLRYIRQMCNNFQDYYNGIYIIEKLFINASLYFESNGFYKTANGIRKLLHSLLLTLKTSHE